MNAQNDNQTSCAKRISTIFPPSINVNKFFFTILFTLYLVLSLIYFIWAINVIVIIPTLLGLLALILLSTRIRIELVPIYIYVGFIITSFLISSLIVGRTGSRLYVPIFFIVSSPGIAMILIRGYAYSWGGYIVFYSLALYFFILMLVGIDGPSAMPLMSYNAISIAMLVACISLYIILGTENKKIDLKPALITLAISIWGVGRSGIVSSLFLLLGLLFIRLRSKSKYIYIVILLLIALFSAYLFREDLYVFFMKLPFFSNALENSLMRIAAEKSPRWILWTNYFNNLDIFRLIFGVNVFEDPWPEGEINEYNYHNSFIHLHLQTGFIGLLTLMLIIYAVVKFYKMNKVFFILFITLILRSSTDLFVYFSRFDFIPYFFIFYFLKSSSSRIPQIKPLLSGIGYHSLPWRKKKRSRIITGVDYEQST